MGGRPLLIIGLAIALVAGAVVWASIGDRTPRPIPTDDRPTVEDVQAASAACKAARVGDPGGCALAVMENSGLNRAIFLVSAQAYAERERKAGPVTVPCDLNGDRTEPECHPGE